MNFLSLLNLIRNNKGKVLTGGGILGLGYLKTQEDQPEPTQQQTTPAQPKAQEQKTQPKTQGQKSQPKTQKPQTTSKHITQDTPISLPPLNEVLKGMPTPTQSGSNSGSGDSYFDNLQQEFRNLFVELDKYRQIYDATLEKHMQANELYEKQLLATLPTMSLLLSKTPLNNMTNEDLIHHTTQLFTSMPYANALENYSKLTKGYYLAKMNNVNPSELSTGDLIAIADNPVLAKSADENLAGYLEQIGEVLKLKMKSNLDEIGALKDAYATYRKELEEKGKLLKEMIDMRKVEMTLGINQFKAQTQAQHYETEDWIKQQRNNIIKNLGEKRIKLKEQELKLKEEKQNTPKATKKQEQQGVIPKT